MYLQSLIIPGFDSSLGTFQVPTIPGSSTSEQCKQRFLLANTLDTLDPSTSDTDRRLHMCDRCPKSFLSPHYLNLHRMTHFGIWQYQCSVCPSGFMQKADLRAHMRTHTGERPFRCHLCPMRFAKKWTLSVHIRTHTGERPYKCTLCPKAFSQSNTLKGHMITHKRRSLL